ncbi:hypothetical protein L1049_010466 [Liquidambar formosana]|uniref:FYVE-type domain-containing protein n=1 Tax=Liquidambar formosana TaxID=63359 RepID=A0AAP0N9E1_LIQFO
MLEKIGLPTKPSQRGCNWVVDASHCQGCSSQFTFINRKHHCRRCGGLFCNSCTQQRMILRGQGDSPVRVCEPCKKLEEAARFERRHGYKSRAGRGDSKLTSQSEDEVLNQIIGNDGKESFSSGRESPINMVSSIQRATSSASCSSIQEVSTQGGEEELLRNLSVSEPNHGPSEMGSASPEELRQQALDEKKKYKILKGEGKPDEALKAFKRGKELERQAAALEIYLRKSRKKALSSSNMTEIQKIKEDSKESDIKINRSPQMGKEKDDLAAELIELGWSNMDLRDVDKKPVSISLEGELSTLIGEISQRSNSDKGTSTIDKTEVIALKKKALMLKREGKLTEAKEELKRAKVLEKQLEEQEFLAEAEDSDDELSLLIRSIDIDKRDDLSIGFRTQPGFDFDHLVGIADDLGVDSNFEVTDEDMDDPEIAASLESLGWTEDSSHPEGNVPQIVPIGREALSSQIQSLKREALNKKRGGNAVEAMALLKKAKVLERDLDSLDSQENNLLAHDPTMIQKGSISQTDEKSSNSNKVSDEKVNGLEDVDPRRASKSKLMIQRELLGLKKKALALRREGRLDEAEEELKKGKVLEQQLEEMDNASKVKVTLRNVSSKHPDISKTMDLKDEGEEGDVTDQDMRDPTYLSLLRNLGWQDEDNNIVSFPSKPSKQSDNPSVQITDYATTTQATNTNQVGSSRRSKGEIQRELLGLKRKAFALRRQGQTEEAEEVLRMAKGLEAQMADMEAPKKEIAVEYDKEKENETIQSSFKSSVDEGDERDAMEELTEAKQLEKSRRKDNPQPNTSLSDVSTSTPNVTSVGQKEHIPSNLASKPLSGRDRFKLQQESLAHKRQALKLRREGRMEEAEAEFKLAKALETQLEESAAPGLVKSNVHGAEPVGDVGVEDLLDPQLLSALKAVGLDDANIVPQGPKKPDLAKLSIGRSENSSQERLVPAKLSTGKSENSSPEKIQLEERIKAEKVKAVNLKRLGKQAEALDALRRAKMLEKKLNSLASQ